jgi:hypothetical protein
MSKKVKNKKGGKSKNAKIPRRAKKTLQRTDSPQKAIRKSEARVVEKAKSVFKNQNLVVGTSSNGIKMSEVILDFAESLLEMTENEDQEEQAISIAILIWNLSLTPEKTRKKHVKELAAAMVDPDEHPEIAAENMETIQALIKRKERIYPDISRAIVSHDMVRTPDGIHLNVASTLERGE